MTSLKSIGQPYCTEISTRLDRRKFLKFSLLSAATAGAAIAMIPTVRALDVAELIPTRRYPTLGASQSYAVYVDSADSNLVKAQNSVTGAIEYSSSDAATVIQKTINATGQGGGIILRKGTYILSSTLQSNKANGIEFCGEGYSTVLHLANAVNNRVIQVSSVKDWNIHDLQIDGNRMNQSQDSGAPATNCYGLSAWAVTGLTVQNCFIHDCRDFGINMAFSSNVRILNNYVQNCDANGITVGNQEGGSGTLVSGNTVDGASDVGITGWYADGYTAENNIVRNVNLSRSPWGNQSHVGMMVEYASRNAQYRNNSIENCGTGLSASGGTGIIFDNNRIQNCLRGLYANNADLTLTNTVFDTIGNAPQSTNMYGAIRLDPQVLTTTITGCQFTNIGPYIKGGAVIQLLSPNGTFSDNVIHTANGKYQGISASSGWNIANNTILP
jgi:hypothetical protein